VDLGLKVKAGSYKYLVPQLGSGKSLGYNNSPQKGSQVNAQIESQKCKSLVGLLVKGVNQQVSIARVTLS
jgi:hypothetical protein